MIKVKKPKKEELKQLYQELHSIQNETGYYVPYSIWRRVYGDKYDKPMPSLHSYVKYKTSCKAHGYIPYGAECQDEGKAWIGLVQELLRIRGLQLERDEIIESLDKGYIICYDKGAPRN